MYERRDLLVLALRTLRDVSETLQRGDSGGRFVPGPRLLLMPRAWHAGCPRDCIANGTCRSTYAVLVDRLEKLQRLGPHHYWNLAERYIRSQHLNRDLAYVGGRYFELTHRRISEGFVVYYPAAPLRANESVVKAAAAPKMDVRRARPSDPPPRGVRAIVERWDPLVVPRVVERALDALLFLMPRAIVLPSDVLETYVPKKQIA